MKNFIYLTLFLVFNISGFSQNNTCNCCTEKHTEFDFWIGLWNVTDSNGTKVGTNTIEKIQDNCTLRENWTSAKGNFTGTSYNFYNKDTNQWEQIWVDNQGGNLHLKGNRTGNQMILRSDELTNKEGQPFFHRITWTMNDDGSVRQLWETITNEKDVTIAFDGLYKKAE